MCGDVGDEAEQRVGAWLQVDLSVLVAITAAGELTFGAEAAGIGSVGLGVGASPALAFLLLAVIFDLAIRLFQIEWNCALHGVSVADCGKVEGSATGIGVVDILFSSAHIAVTATLANVCKIKIKPGARFGIEFASSCPGMPKPSGNIDCLAQGAATAVQSDIGNVANAGGNPAAVVGGIAGDIASVGAGAIACSSGVPPCRSAASASSASGGVYALLNDEGEVVYIGRTNKLARRLLEHARDKIKGKYEFEVLYRTDDYAVARGLEQIEFERFHPILNKLRPISRVNPNGRKYLSAAEEFLSCIGG